MIFGVKKGVLRVAQVGFLGGSDPRSSKISSVTVF